MRESKSSQIEVANREDDVGDTAAVSPTRAPAAGHIDRTYPTSGALISWAAVNALMRIALDLERAPSHLRA